MIYQTPQAKKVETLNYTFGGFHPVHLGDQLKKDRYCVIHNLGHGGFATVWLARDRVRGRYVALKILASRLSSDCPEVEILRRLRNGPKHSGKPYVMFMLDHFWINGPNGKHLCVVSEIGGPSIKQFNDCSGQPIETRRLRASVARRVSLQATEGLAYIHSTGIVHGDFTSSNILLQLANMDEWSVEQVYERLGEPRTQDVSGSPDSSGPNYTVNAVNMREVDPQWLSDRIIIIDFGIAFLQDQSSPDIGTPKVYCAPEFLFGDARSVSSDIWALGCTIFEIRTGSPLFRYDRKPSRNQMLVSMIRLLGNLPDEWWGEWEEGREWYESETKDGKKMTETMSGSLYHQIMETGTRDEAAQVTDSQQKNVNVGDYSIDSRGHEHEHASDEKLLNSTERMIEMVGGLTTDEAKDVIGHINETTHSSVNEDDSNPGLTNKTQTNSSSSNAKSAEKSISSEGISTGTRVASSIQRVDNVIGTEALGVVGSVKDATASTKVEEFLEPAGTLISAAESEGLENLLRKALRYLPEQRLAPSELAKHHWFFDAFETRMAKINEEVN